jgi:hypothetical protein
MSGYCRSVLTFGLAFALSAGVVHAQETQTMLPQLPEGDGIAAKYPGDAGIEQDTEVVFADGFEGFEDDRMVPDTTPQKGKKWDESYNGLVITRDPENVHSGRQAAEVTHTQPSGNNAIKNFEPGLETMFIRYYMKFHPEFPGCHHTGMCVFGGAPGVTLAMGSATGVVPDGRSHFVALLDTLPPRRRSNYPPPGPMNVYCYHMDQGRIWGDLLFPNGDVVPPENEGQFGEDFVPRPSISAERGRWYCYELMVKLNTPGERDGRVAFWVDGKLAGDFPNLRFRNTEELKANHAVILVHSSSTAPNKTLWYDDVVVARSYIGPQVPAQPE